MNPECRRLAVVVVGCCYLHAWITGIGVALAPAVGEVILLELGQCAVLQSVAVAYRLLVSQLALKHCVEEESLVLHSQSEADVHLGVRRVLYVDVVFRVEFAVVVLVDILDVARCQRRVAASVLVKFPVVNLLLALEEACRLVHSPYHAALAFASQVGCLAALVAVVEILVVALREIERHVVSELADGVLMSDGEIPSPCLQLTEVHRRIGTVCTGRRREEIARGRCDLVGLIAYEVVERHTYASVPESHVHSEVVVVGLAP